MDQVPKPQLDDSSFYRYYERELGAGLGPSPSLKEHFGYSEPLRRFIQRASFEPQANEIPNTMPSWLPGDDYMTNFKVGDPYVGIDDGYARLPGAGYEALHPELKGLSPEDYPDIHKVRILGDVAPYSREYNQVFPSCLTQKLSRTRARPAPLPLRRSYQPERSLLSCSTQRGQARAHSLTRALSSGRKCRVRWDCLIVA